MCFCVLGRSAMSPGCVGWTYILDVPWNTVASFLYHLCWVLQECPCVHMVNSQANLLWGSVPTIMNELLYRYWSHEAKFASAGSGACLDLPLDVLLVKLIDSCSDVDWSLLLGVLILRPLGRDYGAGQCQMLPAYGKPFWSYRRFQSFWLPLQVLGVCGKNQDAHQRWLPLALSPDHVPSHPEIIPTCLCLLAAGWLGSVTERTSCGIGVAWGRFSVNHQVGVSGIHQTDTLSDLVQTHNFLNAKTINIF